MNITTKATALLDKAKNLAASNIAWPDFSNEMFDQSRGQVAKAFPDALERQAFYDSKQYNEIHAIMAELMKKQGTSTPPKSGKFVVRMPKTLHEVLDVEARREGVSLNQLVVTKLAFPLREKIDLDTETIVRAYSEVYDGYAVDRVVVDPELNARFLQRCGELGLSADAYTMNHALFDIRKSGKADLPPTTKKTVFHDFDNYGFGSEIAVRVLQKTEGVSLDRILCDPILGRRFDEISASLVSEKSALKRRWAALNLRKTRRLQPSDLQGPTYKLVSAGPVRSIPLDGLPSTPATYAFYDANRPIFAGETDNLKQRIEMHLRAKSMPGAFDLSSDEIVLKKFVAASLKPAERQRWLKQFINDERPMLNYQKTA